MINNVTKKVCNGVIKYVAEDGKEFDTQVSAIDYSNLLNEKERHDKCDKKLRVHLDVPYLLNLLDRMKNRSENDVLYFKLKGPEDLKLLAECYWDWIPNLLELEGSIDYPDIIMFYDNGEDIVSLPLKTTFEKINKELEKSFLIFKEK